MERSNNKMLFFLRLVSYILVAALASRVTLLLLGKTTKRAQLDWVIKTRVVGEAPVEDMEDAAAYAMVSALGDRWSYYIPASQYQSYEDGKTNSYVGIGITILKREDGTGFDITTVEPDSAAAKAGILPGDILIEAEGQPLADMDIDGPGNIIKGEEGTSVTVIVLREGEKLTFTMERQRIQSAVATGQLLDGNVGYVHIKNFNDNCAEHTIAAIEDLLKQGAESFVFDVRYNGGGYVTELVEVLDYLLPEGLLFRSVEDGKTEDYTSDADCLELPMAVLVNGSSYSAAEFFAAALSEYDWAVVVGEPTCGKSYFQNTFQFSDGSAVGLSVGQYYTPKGVSLAEVGGLVPAVLVEVDDETAALIYSRLLKPEEDPQLQEAISAMKDREK